MCYTRLVKLPDWAKREGISYLTAWRWWKEGRLPVPAHQAPSGSILVDLPPEMAVGRTVVYARVSSHDQRSDLERQVARVTEWVTANGMAVNEVVTEVGSGLNGRRRRFQRLLADRHVTAVVVEHRNRLAHFGSGIWRRLCQRRDGASLSWTPARRTTTWHGT